MVSRHERAKLLIITLVFSSVAIPRPPHLRYYQNKSLEVCTNFEFPKITALALRLYNSTKLVIIRVHRPT